MDRPQKQIIFKDLDEKYVFLGGPRQSGKTTLAKQLIVEPGQIQYLNYDRREDRAIFIEGTWSRQVRLVILDEVHKYPGWKTHLKGYFDTDGIPPAIVVTGSAKLNTFKKGNDSMAGRYFYHRLLPLSVKELLPTGLDAQSALRALLRFGNFPDPFLKASETYSRRWQKQYFEKLVREDVTDLSNIRQLPKIELLIDLLRMRIGSSVSYTSLARDLEVAPKTIKEWIDLLEALYIVFRVTPYHHNIARSLLKEPKIYFFDSSMGKNEGARLENLVAVLLLKELYFLEDSQGRDVGLYYLRTKDGLEVDFLTVLDGVPHSLIEVKQSESAIGNAFWHFKSQLRTEHAHQLCLNLRQPKTVDGVQVEDVAAFLARREM